MWLGITDISTFVIGTIIIVLLPGPNSLYVMTIASRHGVAQGYRGAAGIVTGDAILMLLSVLGVSALLQAFPAVFAVLQYAGAAYLAWLGLQLCRSGWRRWPTPAPALPFAGEPALSDIDQRDHKALKPGGNPFRSALLISLMNPKAILFFISFFVQFVSPDYAHPALSFLALGLIVQMCSITYLSALIWGGVGLTGYLGRRQRLAATATVLVGVLFMAFGVRLALSGLG